MKWFWELGQLLIGDGRQVVEPHGQDGYSCLFLALLHQVDDIGEAHMLPSGYDERCLRRESRAWLADPENATVVIDDDISVAGELSLLRDYSAEYSDFITSDTVYGSHPALIAALVVLSHKLSRRCRAVVSALTPFE